MRSKKQLNDDERLAEKEEYVRLLKVLGARIRTLRKQRGWSWRDMVVLHDFHLSKWQSFESGRYGISLPSLLQLSKLFGMSLSEFFAGLEQEAAALEPSSTKAQPPAPEAVSTIAKEPSDVGSGGGRKRVRKVARPPEGGS